MIHLPLPLFLEIVREFEETATEEERFWNAHETLGNFLASPFGEHYVTPLKKFLGGWRSIRREIYWSELSPLWTPEMVAISSAFSDLALEDCDFTENLAFSAHQISISRGIEILYARLRMVEGIGATNASKLLAVAMPKLFVMWDHQNIRKFYPKLKSTPKGYRGFIEDMQQYAVQLISEISTTNHCTVEEAVKWLENRPVDPEWESVFPRPKPIAKLLDEYNYSLPSSKLFERLLDKET